MKAWQKLLMVVIIAVTVVIIASYAMVMAVVL